MTKKNMYWGIAERLFTGLMRTLVLLSCFLFFSPQSANSQTCPNIDPNIKTISAGAGFTVGLKDDGSVVAAGHNWYGQLNVSEWRNIKSISAGEYHTVGLKEDGTVVAVGRTPTVS